MYTTFGNKTKDITQSIAGGRKVKEEEEVDDVASKDKTRPSSIKPTPQLYQRQHWVKL